PSGTYATMIAISSPTANQYYYTTDTKSLYQYISGVWTLMFTDVNSANFDTLFFTATSLTNPQPPANLWAGNVNTTQLTIRAPSGATVNLTEGITSGIRYLMPDGADKTWGIGSSGHHLK